MKIKNSEQFISSDLSLVTALSFYCPLISVDKSNPHKAQFIFERTSTLESILDKYWNKSLLVEPRAFFDQLKAIKARLYGTD